jgi:ribosomal protein L11 methyltransferase
VYYALQIEVRDEEVELLQALLDDTGSLGLEIRDATLKLPPGTEPPPPGHVQLRAWYERGADAEAALQQVRESFPSASAWTESVEAEDWAETWKRHVRPVHIGRLWVGPPWELARAPGEAVAIVIEPGMAFGTGDHPTTALCLAALDRELSLRPGAAVLDVGTGSGVLAIAAMKLGAARVVGSDIDPRALSIARENAEQNGVPGLELTLRPLERIACAFDVVVANLFPGVLCQLAPRLRARLAPRGVLLASGILGPQVAEVLAAFERERLRLLERRDSGEWALLALEPLP